MQLDLSRSWLLRVCDKQARSYIGQARDNIFTLLIPCTQKGGGGGVRLMHAASMKRGKHVRSVHLVNEGYREYVRMAHAVRKQMGNHDFHDLFVRFVMDFECSDADCTREVK